VLQDDPKKGEKRGLKGHLLKVEESRRRPEGRDIRKAGWFRKGKRKFFATRRGNKERHSRDERPKEEKGGMKYRKEERGLRRKRREGRGGVRIPWCEKSPSKGI